MPDTAAARSQRIEWLEAERIRREARDAYRDSLPVCAARLRLINAEVDAARVRRAH